MRVEQEKDNTGDEERLLQEVLKNKEGGGTGEPQLSYSADVSTHFLL